jgi:hypothetical protein
MAPTMSQIDTVHTLLSYPIKIHFNEMAIDAQASDAVCSFVAKTINSFLTQLLQCFSLCTCFSLLHCIYIPNTADILSLASANDNYGKLVKGTILWPCVSHWIFCAINLFQKKLVSLASHVSRIHKHLSLRDFTILTIFTEQTPVIKHLIMQLFLPSCHFLSHVQIFPSAPFSQKN